MTTVTIHQAETNLSELIERANAGEEIMIVGDEGPVARLEPLKKPAGKRGLAGIVKGKWPDLPGAFFFDPLPEDELRMWEGAGDEDEAPR